MGWWEYRGRADGWPINQLRRRQLSVARSAGGCTLGWCGVWVGGRAGGVVYGVLGGRVWQGHLAALVPLVRGLFIRHSGR